MDVKRVNNSLCAFNISRQAFISLHVRIANTPLTRLHHLLGRVRMRSDEGLWVLPSRGIHAFGLMLPVDVVYLDPDLRIIDLVENLRMARLRWQCASVLRLPGRSVYDSGTQVGDRLLIGTPEEMREYWESQRPGPGPGPPDLRKAV
jgi:uncharacterized membrane protein (UPF0127 family)